MLCYAALRCAVLSGVQTRAASRTHLASLPHLSRSVMVGGSDVTNDHTAEFFYPPHLVAGPRPTIKWAPDTATWGQQLPVQYSSTDAVNRVILIRTGSATHSQGFGELQQSLFSADTADWGQNGRQLAWRCGHCWWLASFTRPAAAALHHTFPTHPPSSPPPPPPPCRLPRPVAALLRHWPQRPERDDAAHTRERAPRHVLPGPADRQGRAQRGQDHLPQVDEGREAPIFQD